jgi:DNA helicase HerA-like ATPase
MSSLDSAIPVLTQIYGAQNEYLQRAFASFVLHNIYQGMFQRGPQQHLSHVIIFDEAHRAARLKLMAPMAKECRKYGLAFVAASQEARDFDDSLFSIRSSHR